MNEKKKSGVKMAKRKTTKEYNEEIQKYNDQIERENKIFDAVVSEIQQSLDKLKALRHKQGVD